MSEEITDKTDVEEISLNEIDDLLDIGGSIAMLPNEKVPEKKPNVFSAMGPDTTFLDNPPVEDNDDNPPADPPVDENPPEDPPADPAPVADTDDILAPPADDLLAEEDDTKNKGGRPAALIAAAKKLVEKKVLLPFDDGKKLDDYTAEDFEEMIEANFQRKEGELQEQLPAQFFSNMPPEMQQAYKYIAEGGQDLKGLFQSMGASQEIRELNIESEGGQAYAVRAYLQATNYGTPEEIEEEIQSLVDRGDLEKKANQFKPKLDAMSENLVQQRIAAQEQANQKRQAQSQNYMENVYTVLEKGEVNGIKLDDRTQNLLYAGLVQPNYPSINGKQTNLLGHLLEKYQWVEPNHDLIAEALWLLADPDSYRGKIREGGETAAVEKTVRKLKTEQSNLANGGGAPNEPDEPVSKKRDAIPRPKRNFFARN
jgi:hypothetical protein